MERVILQGIYQVLKDMIEKQQENQQALIESLNELKTAVSNIKISADSINLNTDTLESKLDTVNSSIGNLSDALTNPGSEDNHNIVYWLQTIDTRLSNVGTEIGVQSGYLASIVNNTENNSGSTSESGSESGDSTVDLSELKSAIQQTTTAVLDTKGSVDTILNNTATIVTNTTNANSKLDTIVANTTPASTEEETA